MAKQNGKQPQTSARSKTAVSAHNGHRPYIPNPLTALYNSERNSDPAAFKNVYVTVDSVLQALAINSAYTHRGVTLGNYSPETHPKTFHPTFQHETVLIKSEPMSHLLTLYIRQCSERALEKVMPGSRIFSFVENVLYVVDEANLVKSSEDGKMVLKYKATEYTITNDRTPVVQSSVVEWFKGSEPFGEYCVVFSPRAFQLTPYEIKSMLSNVAPYVDSLKLLTEVLTLATKIDSPHYGNSPDAVKFRALWERLNRTVTYQIADFLQNWFAFEEHPHIDSWTCLSLYHGVKGTPVMNYLAETLRDNVTTA